MDVLGSFSNDDLHARLSKVAKKLRVLRRDEQAQPRPRAERRLRPGWVLKAIAGVLADAGAPMRPKEIQDVIEARLGRRVASSSVKDALATHCSGDAPRFVRVGRGRYALATE